MKNPPCTTDEIFTLSFNLDDGHLIIDNIELRPCGAGTDHVEVARDDGKMVMATLTDLRNEVYSWRHYAVQIRHLIANLPLPDGTRIDVDRLMRERDEAVRRALKAEQRVRDTLCRAEISGKPPCGECPRCNALHTLKTLESDGE